MEWKLMVVVGGEIIVAVTGVAVGVLVIVAG